jgi:hypothetical protein
MLLKRSLMVEFQSLGLLANSYFIKNNGTAELMLPPVGNRPNWKVVEGGVEGRW